MNHYHQKQQQCVVDHLQSGMVNFSLLLSRHYLCLISSFHSSFEFPAFEGEVLPLAGGQWQILVLNIITVRIVIVAGG